MFSKTALIAAVIIIALLGAGLFVPQNPSGPTSTKDQIKEMLGGYYETFNKHSVEGNLAYFTINGTKILNHGSGGTFKGYARIREQLTVAFNTYPDIHLKNIRITNIEINGDKATIRTEYVGSSESKSWYDPTMSEDMELAKVDGAWQIAKTDAVY